MSQKIQKHIIKSQQYEIHLQDKAKASEFQNKISHLQSSKIQGVLQKIMDRYGSDKFLDKFDRIELDLGSIREANFEQELQLKLEETLSNFFKDNRFDNGSLRKGKRISLQNKYIDQFRFFMHHGYMTWDASSNQSISEIFENIFKDDPKELTELLKREGKKETVRKRMIAQFKDPLLEKVVIAVVGNEGTYINAYRQEILSNQKQSRIVEAGEDNFRNATWEIILAYVLVETSSYSSQKQFLKYMITKIASRYRLTYSSLLKNLSQSINQLRFKGAVSQNLSNVLNTLQEEETIKLKGLNKQSYSQIYQEDTPYPFFQLLEHLLVYGSLPPEAPIMTLETIVSRVQKEIYQSPADYEVFFKNVLPRAKNNLSYIPDSLWNVIIEKLNLPSFNITNDICNLLQKVSKDYKEISVTLDFLQKNKGRLGASLATKTISAQEIVVQLLLELTKETKLDVIFFEILRQANQKETTKEIYSIGIQRFLQIFKNIESVEISRKEKPLSGHVETVAMQIYDRFNKNEKIQSFQFQKTVWQYNIPIETLQLTDLYMQLFEKSSQSNESIIKEWLRKRTKELQEKGKKVVAIFEQVTRLMKLLKVEERLLKVLQEYIIVFETAQTKKNQKSSKGQKVSKTDLLDCINIVKKQLTVDQKGFVLSNVIEEIKSFAKEKGVLWENLYQQLVDWVAQEEEKELVSILKLAKPFSEKPSTPQQFQKDLVQYFLKRQALPWWAKETTSTELVSILNTVIQEYPTVFADWLSTAKNQLGVLRMLDVTTFEMFVKHHNTSVNQKIWGFYQEINALINQEIAAIRSVNVQTKVRLRFELLRFIYRNPTITSISFADFIIHQLVSIYNLKEETVILWTEERMLHSSSDVLKGTNLQDWIQQQAVDKKTKSVLEIALEKQLKHPENWKPIKKANQTDTLFFLLQQFHTEEPTGLQSLLKRASFRKKIWSHLTKRTQIAWVQSLFTPVQRQQFDQVWESVQLFKKQITTTQFESFRYRFLDLMLHQWALAPTSTWSVTDLARIIKVAVQSIIQKPEVAELLILIVAEVQQIPDQKELYEEVQKAYQIPTELSEVEEEIKVEEDLEEIPLPEEDEDIYVQNAGVVILGPYIPMLFDRLGYVDNGKFKDDESIQKAMHLLQYAVTGAEEDEEQNLILNKIICGVAIHEPIPRKVALLQSEKDMVDSLLQGVIANWSVLKNTTVEGLQETFFIRDGRLRIEEDSYILTVEEQTFDMLLDQIPWSISKLKLSWMEKLLEVVWRS